MDTETYGTFDGERMVGDDGKIYPVPANYASKSKLVEGDKLAMRTADGRILFKQIEKCARREAVGTFRFDEAGNPVVVVGDVPFDVLTSSATYFGLQDGDEVVVTVPAAGGRWASIDGVIDEVH
jgi:hypothetical protein